MIESAHAQQLKHQAFIKGSNLDPGQHQVDQKPSTRRHPYCGSAL